MYISIQKRYQGVYIQHSYDTIAEFSEEIKRDIEGNKNISWAHLFTEQGILAATYKQGYTRVENLLYPSKA